MSVKYNKGFVVCQVLGETSAANADQKGTSSEYVSF